LICNHGSGFAAQVDEVKSLLISASLIAVGVWYFHRVADDRAHPTQPDEQKTGEIIVANAPDGLLRGRWQSPTPAARDSK